MEKPIVACVQHRLLVPKSHDEFVSYLQRFLRMAKAKGAVLALFPELSGLATAIPNFTGWRNALLKTAGQGAQSRRSFWQRAKSRLAGSAATVVRADLHQTLLQYLQEMPESLHDAYISVFANLARQYEMTIVAGSMYEHDAASGVLRNVSLVFGPDGSLLGQQAKVILAARDKPMAAAAAEGWNVISTPAGRVGILLGNDVLYPEPARVLAYQGADMLLTMGAVNKPATYHKIRQAALARCQENQLYGMVSFLVGPDPFAATDDFPFLGRSAIFAPLEFTPRFSGVMVQVGSPMAEGVITAEWDYPALQTLWQESDTPLRREMPLLQAGSVLASVYAQALPLAEAEALMLPSASTTEAEPAAEPPETGPAEEAPAAEAAMPSTEKVSESLEASLIRGLTPILPPIPAGTPDELEIAADADALSGRVDDHARNVEAAVEEVRQTITEASARVRSVAAEQPEAVEAHIQQTVSAVPRILDEAPILPESPVEQAAPHPGGGEVAREPVDVQVVDLNEGADAAETIAEQVVDLTEETGVEAETAVEPIVDLREEMAADLEATVEPIVDLSEETSAAVEDAVEPIVDLSEETSAAVEDAVEPIVDLREEASEDEDAIIEKVVDLTEIADTDTDIEQAGEPVEESDAAAEAAAEQAAEEPNDPDDQREEPASAPSQDIPVPPPPVFPPEPQQPQRRWRWPWQKD